MPCRKEVLGSKQVYFNRSSKVMEEYPSLNNTTTNASLFHNFCYKVVFGGADGPDGHDFVCQRPAMPGLDMGQGTSYGCYGHHLLQTTYSNANILLRANWSRFSRYRLFLSELTQPNFWVLQFCHACHFSYEPSSIPIGQVVQAQELFQWKNL